MPLDLVTLIAGEYGGRRFAPPAEWYLEALFYYYRALSENPTFIAALIELCQRLDVEWAKLSPPTDQSTGRERLPKLPADDPDNVPAAAIHRLLEEHLGDWHLPKTDWMRDRTWYSFRGWLGSGPDGLHLLLKPPDPPRGVPWLVRLEPPDLRPLWYMPFHDRPDQIRARARELAKYLVDSLLKQEAEAREAYAKAVLSMGFQERPRRPKKEDWEKVGRALYMRIHEGRTYHEIGDALGWEDWNYVGRRVRNAAEVLGIDPSPRSAKSE